MNSNLRGIVPHFLAVGLALFTSQANAQWRQPTVQEDPNNQLNWFRYLPPARMHIVTVPIACPAADITEPNWSVTKTWTKIVRKEPVDPLQRRAGAPFTPKFATLGDHSFSVTYSDSGVTIPALKRLTVLIAFEEEEGVQTWFYDSVPVTEGDSRYRRWQSPGSRIHEFDPCTLPPNPGGGGPGGDPD
jgi:hypothetical protein